EVLDQLDLLIGEWANLLAIDAERSDRLTFLEHRHDQKRASRAERYEGAVGVFGGGIGEMDHLLRADRAIERNRCGSWDERVALPFVGHRRGRIVDCHTSEPIALAQGHVAEAGLTNARRVGKY